MKSYWFKHENFVGFVLGETDTDIFWQIDEFIDPHKVKMKPARYAGFCFEYNQIADYEFEIVEIETGMLTTELPITENWLSAEWESVGAKEKELRLKSK